MSRSPSSLTTLGRGLAVPTLRLVLGADLRFAPISNQNRPDPLSGLNSRSTAVQAHLPMGLGCLPTSAESYRRPLRSRLRRRDRWTSGWRPVRRLRPRSGEPRRGDHLRGAGRREGRRRSGNPGSRCRARLDDRHRHPPGTYSRKRQAARHRSAGTGWLPGSRHRPARPLPTLALVRRLALAHDEARGRHVAGRPSRHRDQCKPGTSPLPARVLRCSSEQSEDASGPFLTARATSAIRTRLPRPRSAG